MTFLLLEPLHPDATLELEAAANVRLAAGPAEALAIAAAEQVEAIVTRARALVGAELMDACGASLRAVARAGSGLDSIDVDAARARDLAVVSAPGVNARATAEHALALALASTRRVIELDRAVRAGEWASARERRPTVELCGRTLGVVGLGAAGRALAELGTALGMRVLYWSRASRDDRFVYRPLDELLGCADVVSLHVALNDGTRRLIGAPELATMKPTAHLVNVARGGVVDEDAVAAALHAGRLAGYASDVLAAEPPPPGHPLLAAPLTVLTPHTAALGERTYREVSLYCVRNLVALLRGGEVDPAALAA